MLQDTRILCTAVASPQAKPLSWLTLRLATLLVLSNTNPWRSPPPRAPTNSVRGFTLVIRSPRWGPTTASVLSSLPFELCSKTGYQPVSKRVATALPHTVVHPAGMPPLLPLQTEGVRFTFGLPCLEFPPEHRSVTQAALATYHSDFYSNHAPGHQLASKRPCRAVRAVSQTARG